LLDLDPEIGELNIQGGTTATHALRRTSPARDQGLTSHCAAADQRGFMRPTDGDGDGSAACDSGAYEAEAVPLDIIFSSGFE